MHLQGVVDGVAAVPFRTQRRSAHFAVHEALARLRRDYKRGRQRGGPTTPGPVYWKWELLKSFEWMAQIGNELGKCGATSLGM